MTFLSLLALALGMIAATDAAAPRPAFAAIQMQRGSRASRRHVRVAAARVERDRIGARPRFRTTSFRRFLAPLTGAASPRAPASHC
jgi:hypothetical protein